MKRSSSNRQPSAFSVEREARASARQALRVATNAFGRRIKVQVDRSKVDEFLAMERQVPRHANDGSFLKEFGRLPERMLSPRLRGEVERRLALFGAGKALGHAKFNLFNAWRTSPFQKTGLVRFKADLQTIGLEVVFRGAGISTVRARAEPVRALRAAASELIAGRDADAFVIRATEAFDRKFRDRLRYTARKLRLEHLIWGTLATPFESPDDVFERLFQELVWFGIVPRFDDVMLRPDHLDLFRERHRYEPPEVLPPSDRDACYRTLAEQYKRRIRAGFLVDREPSWCFDQMDRTLVNGWFPPQPPLDPEIEGCRAVMLSDRFRYLPCLVAWWLAVAGKDFAVEAFRSSARFELKRERRELNDQELYHLRVERVPDGVEGRPNGWLEQALEKALGQSVGVAQP